MKTISVNLPEAFVNGLEALVQRGLYANRSEAIRVAVRDLMKRELVEPIHYKGEPAVPGKVEDAIFNRNTNPPPDIPVFKSPSAPDKPQAKASNISASKPFISPFFVNFGG